MTEGPDTAGPRPEEVVIFQPEFVEFGGEERVILALSEGLHAADLPHRVVCYRDHIDLAQHAREPLQVHALNPAGSSSSKVRALRGLLLDLRAMGAPVPMLFNIQSALHAGAARLAGGLRYHLRIPDTYSLLSPSAEHQVLNGGLARWTRETLTGNGVRGALDFFTNTSALANEMEQLYGRRAEVLYLGGFGEGASPPPQRDASRVHLLSVSRLQKSKRVDWMLRALAGLRADSDTLPWQLHIVGNGPERDALEQLSRTLELGEWVVFHGFVDDLTLKGLYNLAHLFLMPARQGYGLPAIEALHHHCAVVMNTESGVAEVLQGSPWVGIAEPGEQAFGACLKAMLIRTSQPSFFDQKLPRLPSMEAWASQLIDRAGW
ncbi:glycosyltransferase family 4 protein [Hydrogenophaga sp.]|uniref:glycosyltransferase family 4 protein n=1 Tax=Hydrogenophaga sp. TaxID=1904254 RepID=UPI00261CD271|nr:glycosyltransferase family 4 protein [Hydrogenophaga sp.]MDM7948615.1 glycosyltransferase family 4 protein [Hydrogenophaga sp.]